MTKKYKLAKIEAITNALNSDPVDISALKQQAIGKIGLVNDELRRKAWPKMLGVDSYDIKTKPDESKLKLHKYYDQVVLDVNRSLSRFPPAMKEEQRVVLQDQLTRLIMRVLLSNPHLHYYQGYHDICVTFLLVLGEDLSYAVIDRLSNTHLRDFMDATMDRTKKLLDYLFPIIAKAQPDLHQFLERSEVGNIFCLSWLITWYGHVLDDPRHTVRLYDFFLACHPLMPIYLAAAIILHREKEIMATECEMCSLHQLLSHLPDDLPFEELISKAGDLFLQFPKESLSLPREASFFRRLQSSSSYTLTNFEKFQHLAPAMRPDAVLRQRHLRAIDATGVRGQQLTNVDGEELPPGEEHGPLLKATVWVLTAAMGMAIFAMQYIAREI